MSLKNDLTTDVLTAARERTAYAFDHFDKVAVSFSGGKDSTVMLHLAMDEAIKRNRQVAVLIIDLEAQYTATVDHLAATVEAYRDHIDLHWCCFPMSLRNGVSNYEPSGPPGTLTGKMPGSARSQFRHASSTTGTYPAWSLRSS